MIVIKNTRTLSDRLRAVRKAKAVKAMIEAGVPAMAIQEAVWIDTRDQITQAIIR